MSSQFLRMSLVHNKQLASICRKLGLIDFLHSSKTEVHNVCVCV